MAEKMIALIHNILALVNPAALPALRIAATFFFLINLIGGAFDNDIPAARRFRVEVIMIPWFALTTALLILLISFWLA
jgi:hypothetical protein